MHATRACAARRSSPILASMNSMMPFRLSKAPIWNASRRSGRAKGICEDWYVKRPPMRRSMKRTKEATERFAYDEPDAVRRRSSKENVSESMRDIVPAVQHFSTPIRCTIIRARYYSDMVSRTTKSAIRSISSWAMIVMKFFAILLARSPATFHPPAGQTATSPA